MLRKRKNRRYNETNDEEGDGERKFDLLEQIKSERFDQIRDKHLQELSGEAIDLRLVQKNGFDKPILVVKPEGLHLRVPPKSFLVRDVRNCVGPQRIIDVMDVKTQKNIEMSMKDWCKYYESKNRDRLLNVISLEFSHTKLDELVDSPMIVKLLDWVDLVWPKFLKQSQTESTNSIDKMKYPKVQKYCLMSVKGSYTDFHIDFGGTSVWYHILRGRKIFWMVPPTELNLQIFEEWTLSGMQQDVFFGDTVEECFRVELCAGNTFFIPSGWIHAVYTMEDSLVFGGNFLHSFGIENQLKVSKIEDATKVPVKFRYPFYTEILWYAVQHYVYCLMNKDHLHRPVESTSSPSSAINSKQLTAAGVDKKSNNSIEIEEESTESEYEESDKSIKTSKKSKKAPTKKTTVATKRKRQNRPTKSAQKKSRKPSTSSDNDTDDETEEEGGDDDGESTDIDSANEELYSKTVEKPTANTCRMTKNSLLRLQYEIDEHSTTASSSTSPSAKKAAAIKSATTAAKGERTNLSSGGGSSMNASKSKSTASPERQAPKVKPLMAQQPQQTSPQPVQPSTIVAPANVNLIDGMLESKLNGWPASLGGQNTWSSPKVPEPKGPEPKEPEPKEPESKEPARIHITKFEVNGLKVLVKHLSKLSGAKKNLPNLIRNSRALLDDCKKLIAEHENDDPELAITGKPITPGLLKALHPNQKVDLDELILKTSSDKTGASNLDGLLLQLESNHHSTVDEKKATEASSSATQSNKSSTTTHNQKETKCLSPSKKLSNLTALSSGLAAGTSSSASPPPRPKSPPTRPLSNNQYTSKTKMNNNNLLLPGSFADLIAATSTEKKVFDVSTAEVSASLFGIKDLATSKSASSLTTSTTSTSSTAKSSPNLLKATSKLSTSLTTPTAPTSTTNKSIKSQQHDVASAIGVPSIPFAGPTAIGGSSKPISPEPHKPNIPPKRFINPMGFRPLNKEKLIYASAPYISPVHASEQRSMSSQVPYPWQQQQAQQQHHHHPHHHPHQQHQSQNPPTYSPSLASSAPPSSNHRPSTNVHSNSSSSSEQHQQPASYTPDPQVLNQQQHHSSPIKSGLELNHDRQHPQEEQQQQSSAKKELIAVKSTDCGNQSRSEDHKRSALSGDSSAQANSVIVSLNHPQLGTSSSNGNSSSGPENPNTKEAIVKLSTIKTETQTANVPNEPETIQPPTDGEQTVIKKPTKPRGPPKKSKEARQVAIESTSQLQVPATSAPLARFSLPLIPISVIKGGPSGDAVPSVVPGVVQLSTPSSAAPVVPVTESAVAATASGTKTKTKRPKKQKDAVVVAAAAATPSNNNAMEATMTAAQQLTTMAGNQVRPSVICGLVRSPLPLPNLAQVQPQQHQKQQQQTVGIPVVTTPVQGGSGAGKLNPQSYLISRPLFPFPSMPTFSAAQFQQLQQQQHQRPMNLLAAPIGAHSLTGLPLQQGARLVWATQPNRLMSPMPPTSQRVTSATTGMPSSTTANNPPVTSAGLPKVPSSHSADNAALLSLATTALSTAPMTSSPALSHLNNRGLNPQAAIMMSSAAAAAASQQAAAAQLYAGQQFFRPFLPMHYAALAQRPTLTGAGSLFGATATTTTGVGSITTTAVTTTAGPTSAVATSAQQNRPLPGQQLLLARLPNQTNQQRYLITQPSYMQHQRFQAPNIVTSQPPTSTLTYAAYKPPADTSKVIKTKKVKTS